MVKKEAIHFNILKKDLTHLKDRMHMKNTERNPKINIKANQIILQAKKAQDTIRIMIKNMDMMMETHSQITKIAPLNLINKTQLS